MIQAQRFIHLRQSAVVLFKLLEAFRIRSFHTALFGLPVVVGRVEDAGLQADFFDTATALKLLQKLEDL